MQCFRKVIIFWISTPGLEELERFNKIMEETQKNLNIKSGSRNDIIYEKEADKK